jgi:DNA invertase Pin-like site-specific DNA recombinase
MTIPKRAALYARVSTKEQNPEAQTHPLQTYAEARGFQVVPRAPDAPCFVDHGISGTKDRRPALDEMMALVRSRKVDAVVAVKLDRLARSMRHLTDLGAELEVLGVDLIIIDQSIDTSTPAGRLLFNVLGSIAEFERDLLIERTKAGMAQARREGRFPGRPPTLYGPKLQRAKVMRRRGQGLGHIAKMLRVSKTVVARALKDTPKGTSRFDPEWTEESSAEG